MKIKNMAKILILISSIFTMPVFALSALTDQEMSEVEGQALFNLSYLGPTEDVDPTIAGVQTNAGNNIGFYTLSMEAEVALNANIRSLKLGCGGVNNAIKVGCDIDIEKFSLGCIANASGTCITLPPTGIQKTGVNNANSDAGQQLMRDFVLKNPFYQFAIKTPTVAATREVVGVRIGAANVKGPMSFDSINTFSGYLTGKANLTMLGETDVSPTCKTPDVCSNTAGRSRYTDASAYLKLNDVEILSALGLTVNYRDLTADYPTATRSNLDAVVNGTRASQAFIQGLNLSAVVDEIVDNLTINRACIRNFFGCTPGSAAFSNLLLPLLKTGVGDYIKSELARGLQIPVGDLPTYQMPYNLKNVHQLEVNSSVFGLALSKQVLRYPGFSADVGRGWSMYLPDAFTLNISDKTSTLVSNIANNSNARDGNIVGLEAPFRNCWGNARFC